MKSSFFLYARTPRLYSSLARLAISPVLLALSPVVLADAVRLDVQTVSADFRQSNVQQLPEAVTVVDSEKIEARSAEHLEQVLSFAPNVNFSSGSNRARYFQIRGIGDRSQFIDPVNPSVGLMIDGIDMTGLGTAATLFDIDQVEVLRGPQGTRFGANALAGMINIRSKEADKNAGGYVRGKVGNYASAGIGGAVTGSLSDRVQGRLALHHFQSNGYTKNDYLNRDDTQDQNETILRSKLAWQLSADSELKLTYLYANIDNGYDAFTLDNSRHSLADEPGKDQQETHAFSLQYQQPLNSAVNFESTLAGSYSDAVYSFDEDWVYPALDPDTYSYFDQYARTFKRGSFDLRLLSGVDGRIFGDSTDWVIGAYAMSRNETLERDRRKETVWSQYQNELDTRSISLYGELTTHIGHNSRLIYGVRAENWRNEFSASNSVKDNTDEWLYGGKVTFETLLNQDHLAYASYARGYKAGGVNSDPSVSAENRIFNTEYNNAVETGLKSDWLDSSLQTRIAAFYIRRQDQQVKSSYVLPTVPPSFQDYLANAARGQNYGLELEAAWQLTESLLWELSYGYLNTEFLDYTYQTSGGVFNKDGRAQAHAPEHSGASAITWQFADSWSIRFEGEFKSDFYFSDSHDEKSPAYALWHARLGYQLGNLDLALSGRNLTDKETQTRGFGGFGNDPRDGWAEHKYVQLGEPRLVMLEAQYSF